MNTTQMIGQSYDPTTGLPIHASRQVAPHLQTAATAPAPSGFTPGAINPTGFAVPQALEVPTGGGRFAEVDEVAHEEIASGHTRVFVGDGTSFLAAPGLKRLDGLRIGAMPLPFFELRKYPINSSLTDFQWVNEPLVNLGRRSDGVPVIVRALISNDGRWPQGAKIYVTGEWESDEAQKPLPDAAPVVTHSASTQAAAEQQDAETRQQVYRATGDARIAGVEGNAPTIVDPVAAVHGTPGMPPVAPPADPSAVEDTSTVVSDTVASDTQDPVTLEAEVPGAPPESGRGNGKKK